MATEFKGDGRSLTMQEQYREHVSDRLFDVLQLPESSFKEELDLLRERVKILAVLNNLSPDDAQQFLRRFDEYLDLPLSG